MSKAITATVIAIILAMSTACLFGSDDASPSDDTPPESGAEAAANGNEPENRPEERDAAAADSALSQEYLKRCRFWALNYLQPIVYAEFSKLNPDTMSDLDRILWRNNLQGSIDRIRIETDEDGENAEIAFPEPYCQQYWAEPLDKSNADLRNRSYEQECRSQLASGIASRYRELANTAGIDAEKDIAYRIPNQYVRILNLIDMPGKQLLKEDKPLYRILLDHHPYPYARQIDLSYWAEPEKEYAQEHGHALNLDWLGIAAAAESDYCRAYYPQLFYGYWIPMDSEIHRKETEADADEAESMLRYDEDRTPLYLPRKVNAKQVDVGFPLGVSEGGVYRTCSQSGSTEDAGYYYVVHPAGDYCERK